MDKRRVLALKGGSCARVELELAAVGCGRGRFKNGRGADMLRLKPRKM